MKILLLTRYDALGVTSRIRFFQYLPYLKEHGIEVETAPFLGDDYVDALYKGQRNLNAVVSAYFRRIRRLLASRRFDLLWVEKELLPWMPAFAERIARPYIVDYDDAIFHNYDLHRSLIVRLILSGKIRTVMSRAVTVVAGNDYLAQYARDAGARDVRQVPTVVDLNRYVCHPPRESGTFTIGWIGTPWTSRYLPAIIPALQEVCAGGAARVLLIGSGKVHLPGIAAETREWSESTEVQDIQDIDVGLMPLPDEPFERGKCGYKLLQYMACGKAVVASPVGANSQIVDSGLTGYLATTTSEWVDALLRLKNDRAKCSAMGRAGRAKVEQTYSLQAQAPRLLEILNNALLASQPKSP